MVSSGAGFPLPGWCSGLSYCLLAAKGEAEIRPGCPLVTMSYGKDVLAAEEGKSYKTV